MTNHGDIAHQVRTMRFLMRTKQSAFADMLGISQAMVSRIESGEARPGRAVTERIQALLADLEARSPLLRINSGVRISQGLESVVYQDKGRVYLSQFSDGFNQLDQQFASTLPGQMLEGRIGDDADAHFDLLKSLGAFDGKMRALENVWHTQGEAGEFYFSARSISLQDDYGRWHIKSTHVPIDANEFDRRSKFKVLES